MSIKWFLVVNSIQSGVIYKKKYSIFGFSNQFLVWLKNWINKHRFVSYDMSEDLL